MTEKMKFTKAQINKERKTIKTKFEIINDIYIDGSIDGLEKRIKEKVKASWKWKCQKWGDGEKFKLSEVSLEAETEYGSGYGGMYDEPDKRVVNVIITKDLPEEDCAVIKRLTANAKAKARRLNAKSIQEKKERTLLKTLKAKYKGKV